jgi:crossover junction endodeoxyribonuclease RusA
VEFTVPGRPVPKGRPRFGKGRAYTPVATREAERVFVLYAAKFRGSFPSGHVRVECNFYVKGAHGDADNLLKNACDSLQSARVFANDRQVRRLLGVVHSVSDVADERTEVLVEAA